MAVHLVRHASAGTRHGWDPDDADRHLDETGERQAAGLARGFVDAPLTAVRSSPAARCIETVTPLAASAGLNVEPDHRLFEGTDVETSWTLLVESAEADGDVVLCSHGDVIPGLIRRLQFRGMELVDGSGCAKASCWTLDGWDGERFARGTYLPPILRK